MKLKMMRGFLVVAAMIPMMMLVACGKKDEGGGAVAVTPATGYYTANNQCYQSGTTTIVAMNLCNQGTGYYQSGNVCYQNGTNAVITCPNQGQYPVNGSYPVGQVPSGYIPGIGGAIGGNIGMVGGGQYQYCMGYFYSPYYGWGICNGTNCHNVMLYNQYGQPVYCP